MANETTTTTAASTTYAKIVTADILQELRPLNVSRPHFRMGPAGPSAVYSFITQTKVNPTSIASITEAADQSTLTAISTSNQDATAAAKGIIAFVTDVLVVVSVLDALPQFSQVLARTAAEQYETDLCGFTSFTNVSGNSTTTTSLATLLQGKTALAGRDVHDVGLCTILHTKQVGDIQQDVATSGATFLANPGTPNNVNDVVDQGMAGYVQSPFGVPLFQTSVVPTADTAASRAGYMFASGVALGLYELWGIRTELQRDASKVGTEIIVTMNYGTAKIDNARGQTIKGQA